VGSERPPCPATRCFAFHPTRDAALVVSVRGATEVTAAPPSRGAYLAGLATNLGNPKAGVFAVSLIPQFIAPEGHLLASGILLGVIWSVTTATWYVVFVTLVDRGRSLVSRPSVTTWLHGITGVVLLLLSAGVVLVA
jgi:threonine/homoserine/homoserine lactone efflux protein